MSLCHRLVLVLSLFHENILCLSSQSFVSTTLAPPTSFQLAHTTVTPVTKHEPKSGEVQDGSRSTTAVQIDAYPMSDDPQSSSSWANMVNSPYFIPSAVGIGAIFYTFFTWIACCYWRRRKNRQNNLEVPHHPLHVTISNASDARSRSMRSTYSNASVRSVALTQSASAHFDENISPSLVGVSHQVMCLIWNSNSHPLSSDFESCPNQADANELQLDSYVHRISRGDDVFVIVNALNVNMAHDHGTDGMKSMNRDGEEDHFPESYVGSLDRQDTEELYGGRGATKGYQHLGLHHESDETAALPASFRNDIDADIGAALPQSDSECPSSEEPLTVHTQCTQCRKEKARCDGRVDENDGYWYCNECWNTFYD